MVNKIDLGKRFIELDIGEIPDNLDDYFLDTLACESQLSEYYGGIDLSKPYSLLGLDSKRLVGFNEQAPFFRSFIEWRRFGDMERVIEKLTRLHGEISSPCSMLLERKEDLKTPVQVLYQISYANDVLFRRKYKNFPENWCGPSSRNVVLSSMDCGIPNVAYVYNEDGDHGYVIMPFLIQDGNIKGSIISDPTYGQLWVNQNKKKTRNAVFIKIGEEWEYIEERMGGKNLYPQRALSFDTLRTDPELINRRVLNYPVCGKSYFNDAFSNPLKLQI